MLNALRRLDRACADAETWLVALLLGASVLLNFSLVVSRYAFSYSLNQLEELSVYFAIWLVFAGAVACDRRNQHIQLDIIYHLLTPSRQRLRSCGARSMILTPAFTIASSVRLTSSRISRLLKSVAAAIDWSTAALSGADRPS